MDDNGALVVQHAALDWHQVRDESEVYFLRMYGAGDPSARAQHLISPIREGFTMTPLLPDG